MAADGRRGSPVRFFAMSALLWLAACVGAVVFHLTSPLTGWHDDSLPIMARASFLGLELFLLAYACAIVALPVFFLLRRPPGPGDIRPRFGRVRFIGGVLVLWFCTFAYVASWLVFRSTGHFLDLTALLLWWNSPVQMFQHAVHMEPLTPVSGIVGTSLFAGGLAYLLRRVWGPLAGPSGWVASGGGLVLVLACLFLPDVIGWHADIGRARARLFEATGPLVRLSEDLRFRLSAADDPIYRQVQLVLERPPIITMEDYVDLVRERRGGGLGALAPSVLIVIVESLRADELVSFGGRRSVMPTVDRLAASGRRFLRHYTQASHSDYADPTVLSSHYPLRSSTYHIYPAEPPYPRVLIYDVLSALGYRVGIFSSQNESWQGMKNYLETGNIDRFLDSETYDGPTYVPAGDRVFEDWLKEAGKSGKIDDRYTVTEAIEWIDASDDPFVIYMNLQNSHVPYVVPADFDAPFGSGHVSFPIRFAQFPRDSVEAVRDLYSSSLAYVDAQLARVVDYLDRSGRLDNTIIVVTADTGQAFYEHGFASHGSGLYDEVMRIPLVIYGPGMESGDEEQVSQHIDIPPTVLGLLDLPPHPGWQGIDLLASVSTESGERTAYLVGQALVDQYALVRGRWKLIYDARAASYVLFDLASDPDELRDLAGDQPDVVARLSAWLHGWRKAQLEYYMDPAAYRQWYPPRLLDVGVPTPPTSP